jgi:hypothetical protein
MFGDVLGGHDRASSEMHLEVVDLEAVYREKVQMETRTLFTSQIQDCGNVES